MKLTARKAERKYSRERWGGIHPCLQRRGSKTLHCCVSERAGAELCPQCWPQTHVSASFQPPTPQPSSSASPRTRTLTTRSECPWSSLTPSSNTTRLPGNWWVNGSLCWREAVTAYINPVFLKLFHVEDPQIDTYLLARGIKMPETLL